MKRKRGNSFHQLKKRRGDHRIELEEFVKTLALKRKLTPAETSIALRLNHQSRMADKEKLVELAAERAELVRAGEYIGECT